MYQELKRTYTAIILLIKPFVYNGVAAAVAAVVFLLETFRLDYEIEYEWEFLISNQWRF